MSFELLWVSIRGLGNTIFLCSSESTGQNELFCRLLSFASSFSQRISKIFLSKFILNINCIKRSFYLFILFYTKTFVFRGIQSFLSFILKDLDIWIINITVGISAYISYIYSAVKTVNETIIYEIP